MSDQSKTQVRLAELSNRKPYRFALEPDAAARADLSETLGILGLRKLRFEGAIAPLGSRDWRLEAHLGATVQQACVATLAPVTTRIEEEVERSYLDHVELPQGDEVEMPEDDTVDPLPEVLDLGEVMTEALALALPPYPRAEGAQGGGVFTEPGKAAMTDEDARPFAGLSALRESLENKDDDTD